jgi:hypothetical protein
MAEYINFENVKVASGAYDIILSFNTSVSGTTNYNDFLLVDWGAFQFGGDDAGNELLVRNSKTTIEFQIPEDSTTSFTDMLDFLLNNDGKIEIFNTTGNPIWKGFTDKKDIKSDYYKRTITLTCKDGFSKNEKLDEATIFNIIDTIGRPTTADRNDKVISFTRLISRLSGELFGITPTLYERTRIFAQLEDETEYDSGAGQSTSGLKAFGTFGYNLLHWNLYDFDIKKSIKAGLTALNSYAINGWYNRLYILPLYYHGKYSGFSYDVNVIDLTNEIIMEHEVIRQWKDFNLVPYYQSFQATYANNPQYYKAPYFQVSEEIENFNIYFPCIGGTVSEFGDDPVINVNDMDVNGISNTLFWLENGGLSSNLVLRVKGNSLKYWINGDWSDPYSLYVNAISLLTGNYESTDDPFTLDNYLLRDKYGLRVKVAGVKYGSDYYSPHHEFTVPWYPNKVFRTRNIKVDLVKNTTELTLLEY